MKSLRVRLAVAFFLLLTAVGIASVCAAFLVVQGEPDELLDDQLRQIAMTVGDTARPLPPPDPPIEADDAILIVIRNGDGDIIRKSDDIVDLPPAKATGFSDVVVKGEGWRSYAIVTPGRVIQAAQRQETRDELANDAAVQAVVPILILIPLSWIVLGVIVTRLFRPLKRLAEDLKQADAENHRPMSTEGVPSEVVPLVDQMNGLLARQNELLELRKRFVSDAAHQLRTPITALQLQVGNLAKAPGAQTVAAEIADIRLGIFRMSRLASQLLDLARAEAPQGRDAPSVALAPVVRQVIETALPLAERRSIDLGVTSEVDVRVRCAEQDLTAALTNVVDNAVRYTPAGGKVDISSEISDERVLIRVTDTGPGIPEADIERVFERFTRAEPAESGGAGLGLAIVKASAARSGMDVALENVSPHGLRVSITAPITDDPAGAKAKR